MKFKIAFRTEGMRKTGVRKTCPKTPDIWLGKKAPIMGNYFNSNDKNMNEFEMLTVVSVAIAIMATLWFGFFSIAWKIQQDSKF